MVYGICSTFQGLFQTALLPRGQYNSWSKHFFAEAGLNLTWKQEGLKPSLVALFNAASSLAQKVLLLCIDLSSTKGGVSKMDLKVVGLKVDLEAW